MVWVLTDDGWRKACDLCMLKGSLERVQENNNGHKNMNTVVCCTHPYRAQVYLVYFAVSPIVISASRQINTMEFNHVESWLTVVINVDHFPIYIIIMHGLVYLGHWRDTYKLSSNMCIDSKWFPRYE